MSPSGVFRIANREVQMQSIRQLGLLFLALALAIPTSDSQRVCAQSNSFFQFISSPSIAENQLRLDGPVHSIITGIVQPEVGDKLPPIGAAIIVPSAPFVELSKPTPIKVCVVQDKTGSSAHYRTPQVTEVDLSMLTDHMVESSGEVGVGFLHEASNWPLTRLYVPLLPEKPERETSSNPRKQMELELAYRKALKSWVEARDRRISEAEEDTYSFFNALRDDLNQTPNAGQSDVAGSLVRCDRFLAEPLREWEGKKVIRVLVMISDAEHAVSAQSRVTNDRIHADLPERLESNPVIYVVNGEKHKGDLAGKYSVIAVESIQAAFRDVISVSNRGR